MRLLWYLCVALLLFTNLGHYLLEFIHNCTQSTGKTEGILSLALSPPLFPSGLIQQLLRILNILGMFKPAYSYCYVFWICFRSCLELNNYLKRSPRDLYQGWIAMSGNVWESTGKYLGQWAPPMFRNFTPEQVQNPEKLGLETVWKKHAVTLAIPETHKSLRHAGAWPMPAQPCSTLPGTLKGKRRALDTTTKRQALRLLQPPRKALQLNQRTNPPWYLSPLYTRRNTGCESQLI